MMDSRINSAAVVRREWIVVLVAGLVGLVLAFAGNRQAPTTTWKATQGLTVTVPSGGPPSPPGTKDLVTVAGLSSVRRSAEDSLGLEPKALDGRVSVAIVGEDKRVVAFTVTAEDEDDAVAAAKAVAQASLDEVFSRYDVYLSIAESNMALLMQRADDAQAQAERLQKAADSLSVADRAGYEQAIVASRDIYYRAIDDAEKARSAVVQLRSFAEFNEPSVTEVTLGGLRLSALLQGLFLGVIAGVAVAAIREWFHARGRASA